jgi:hypothetical protein
MIYDETNSIDCKLLAGDMWIDCKGFEPNSQFQAHCYWFKDDHRCINPKYLKSSKNEYLEGDLFEL